ncbi:MAG: sigma-70 family RNA polymerase sigma factor [Deltaproteobacteria bacterium]|nr:sigma-70 family RNA polymerase sigma factor [Deltaproteobacteria bacterium]
MAETKNETLAALITAHMPLVHAIVAQFMRKLPRSVQREDLVAAGTLGLFYALRASSHTCEEMFAAYARIRIRGAIVDELRRHDWSPRRRRTAAATATPADTQANGAAADGKPANANAPGGVPRLSLVPAPAETVTRVQVVGFDDLPPNGSEIAEECASPLDDVLERREHASLHAAVSALPPREREIVHMRYFRGLPSKAIARAMGLSEARISQLHARATARLKELLQDGGTITMDEVKLAA